MKKLNLFLASLLLACGLHAQLVRGPSSSSDGTVPVFESNREIKNSLLRVSNVGNVSLTGTTGTFIFPTLTDAQRSALTAVNGMVIYNSTAGVFQRYSGGVWGLFGDGYQPSDAELDALTTSGSSGTGVFIRDGGTISALSAGSLQVDTPILPPSGGTGVAAVTAGSFLAGNGTGAMDLATLGAGLSLSGSPGDGTRVLSATTGSFTIDATAATTDDTATTVWSYPVPTRTTVRAQVQVVGAGPTNHATYNLDFLFRREIGDVLMIGSNVVTSLESDADLNATFALDLVNDEFDLRVTGLAGEPLNWIAKGWAWEVANAEALVACVTSDTTIPHDTFIEGWSGDGTENTWSVVGSGGKITVNADTSALVTGKVVGQCDSGFLFDNTAGSGTEEFYQHDLGSAIDVDSQAVDVRFMLWVGTDLDASGEQFTIFSFNPTSTASATLGASVQLNTDGTDMRVLGRGSSSSGSKVLTADSWNEVHLHIGTSVDATGDRSYIAVNGGAVDYFVRSTGGEDLRYLNVGGCVQLDSVDVCVFYVDSLCVNTP